MGVEFEIGGHYPITAERFWNEVFFSESYTQDLMLNGLGFHEVNTLKLEYSDDGTVNRSISVRPKLTLPGPLKRLFGAGFSYQEDGVYTPEEPKFTTKIWVPSAKSVIQIKTIMRFINDGHGGSHRKVDFHVNSSTFGVSRLVEATSKTILTQQYRTAERFTKSWLNAD